MRSWLVLAALIVLADAGVAAPPVPDANWRRVATAADQARLRDWRTRWLVTLSVAREADGGAIGREPFLFAPDRALTEPVPPAGDYRCRTIKLGANGTAMRKYTAYPAVECHVEQDGGVVYFARTGGPQRAEGVIYADGAARAVFLGTLMLGDERRPLQYGRDARRDMAGYVERIGDRRWRITLPAPGMESLFDVIELVPAR